MEYEVTYCIIGKYKVKVTANNITEAEEKADAIYQDTEFGDLTEITDDFLYSISGGGKTHYEK